MTPPPNDVLVRLTVADAATLEDWSVTPLDPVKAESAAEAWKRGKQQ